jgi:hypothetical protein
MLQNDESANQATGDELCADEEPVAAITVA